MAVKDAVIRALWGNEFYRAVLQPYDRWLIEPAPSASFDATPPGINKVCRVADARHPLWQAGYRDLGFPSDTARFHRKIWEFNQTLYGLRTLRRLAPDAVALGIGCGHEELMYFLANRVARVVLPTSTRANTSAARATPMSSSTPRSMRRSTTARITSRCGA